MSLDSRAIKDSFEILRPMSAEMIDKFCEFLWKAQPSSKKKFNQAHLKKHKQLITNTLAFAVENIDHPKKSVPFLEDLGRRLVQSGFKGEHYDWIIEALLKTYKYFLSQRWTPELEMQWTLAFAAMRGHILNGATRGIDFPKVA